MVELLIVALLLTLALCLLLGRAGAARAKLTRIAVLLAAVLVWRSIVWFAEVYPRETAAKALEQRIPLQTQQGGYTSSTTCRACHAEHYDSWHASYHRTMTQAAAPETVLGDFDDVTLRQDGAEYHLHHRDHGLWATVTQDAPGGGSSEMQIVMTTGSHHYQIYWTSEGPDRMLTAFPFAYLRAERRWIPREAALIMPPHLRQTSVRWNEICIRCHSTHGQPRWNESTRSADTRVAELGIACEACHGPADEHVRANQNPLHRYGKHMQAAAPETSIVNPARLSAGRSAQLCGQCHAVATFPDPDYSAGHWNRYRARETTC